jgi:outer membrane receptor protein involved in Fe transport
VLNLNYDNGPVGLFTSVNYTGKVKRDPDAPADFYQFPTRDAVVFVNGGINFDVAKRFGLRFTVDNIFDTKPPYPSPAGGGVVSYFPGILGRYFRAGASVRF